MAAAMPSKCTGTPWCSLPVPDELQTQSLCVLHYLRKVEEVCNELRRETAFGLTLERSKQISERIAGLGEQLIRLSLNGERLSDDLKMGILNGVLALINVRESMNRAAAARDAAQRKAGARG